MILYLSATGNTRWTAESIAAAIGDSKVVDVTTLVDRGCDIELEEGEPLGFFFPVHGWRPPLLFRRFVGKVALSSSASYVYAVCTAGDTIGETMDYLRADLAERGIRLDACFDVRMPNTYVGLPFMDVDPKILERQKIADSKSRMDFIADRIKGKAQGVFLDLKGRWQKINSRFLGEVFVKKLVTDIRFRIDITKCIGCGRCVAVCPVGDVFLAEGKTPRWLHNEKCMTCFACYHSCPKHAIQYGWMTRGKGQYTFTQE